MARANVILIRNSVTLSALAYFGTHKTAAIVELLVALTRYVIQGRVFVNQVVLT